MNIEKLGITPGPWRAEKEDPDYGERNFVAWEDTECDETIICEAKYGMKDASIIATAPEMLGALIEDAKACEKSISESSFFTNDKVKEILEKRIDIIEKACYPKSWEEIKGIL